MKDRHLLFGGLAALLLGLLGLVLGPLLLFLWSPAANDPPQPSVNVQVPRPWEGQATGQIKEFKLTVGRVRWELAPGRFVDAYGYNGRVPGPELRVTEGDKVRVTVTNELTEPTTIHWHGVEVPAGMDGIPKLSQEPIPPGGTFTYQFVATPAGTRWYHSHFDEAVQQADGLVGALIVEPRQATGAADRPPDREYTLVTSEWSSNSTGTDHEASGPTPPTSDGMMGGGMMGGGTVDGGMMGSSDDQQLPDAFMINGKAYPNVPPLVVHTGERVKLRLINAGAGETQAFALAGHKLKITHSDGNQLARPVEAGEDEAVLLGAGERADVEFVADHPGRWQFRDVMPGHAERGLAVDVVYEGHEADPVQGFPPEQRFGYVHYADLPGPAHPSSKPNRTYELTLSGGMMGFNIWTINNKSYPKTEPLDVRQGERVRIKLFNMSMKDHPMHLHGHTFQIVAINGRPVDGPLKDTITVRHMEQYEIEFVANNPGVWLLHCHNLKHMTGGLMTEVRYGVKP